MGLSLCTKAESKKICLHTGVRNGSVAQIEYGPCKHSDLNSILTAHIKMTDMVAYTCNANIAETDIRILETH